MNLLEEEATIATARRLYAAWCSATEWDRPHLIWGSLNDTAQGGWIAVAEEAHRLRRESLQRVLGR